MLTHNLLWFRTPQQEGGGPSHCCNHSHTFIFKLQSKLVIFTANSLWQLSINWFKSIILNTYYIEVVLAYIRGLQPCSWRATILQISAPTSNKHTCTSYSRFSTLLDNYRQVCCSRVGTYICQMVGPGLEIPGLDFINTICQQCFYWLRGFRIFNVTLVICLFFQSMCFFVLVLLLFAHVG